MIFFGRGRRKEGRSEYIYIYFWRERVRRRAIFVEGEKREGIREADGMRVAAVATRVNRRGGMQGK